MQSILLLYYLKWHFIDAPKNILKGWGNILGFNLNYFSIGLLLQTFFSPWRRIAWDYGRGFNLGTYLFTFGSNLISRIIGAIMRSFLIAAGLAAQFAILLMGSFLLLSWLALPGIIAAAFFYGIFLLF